MRGREGALGSTPVLVTPLYPETPRFEEGESAVQISRPVNVQLQTEEEFLDNSGRRKGAREARPAAQIFANQMTHLLAGNDFPLAGALRQAFRTIELGKLILRNPASRANTAYLTGEYSLPAAAVPKEVEGVFRRTEEMIDCGTASQYRSATVHREYRGGVEAAIELRNRDFGKDERGYLATLRNRTLGFRPTADALVWSIR